MAHLAQQSLYRNLKVQHVILPAGVILIARIPYSSQNVQTVWRDLADMSSQSDGHSLGVGRTGQRFGGTDSLMHYHEFPFL